MKRLAQKGLVSAMASGDLSLVRHCASWTHLPTVRNAAVLMSWLGNGWIYALLAGILISTGKRHALWQIVLAGLAIGILHCIYPYIKHVIQRPRPFIEDSSLSPLLPVIDQYSFPSGHLMTLTGSLVPMVMFMPTSLPYAFLLWFVMAWARIASAHHYLSDVLGGSILGIAVSYPLSFLFKAWMLF